MTCEDLLCFLDDCAATSDDQACSDKAIELRAADDHAGAEACIQRAIAIRARLDGRIAWATECEATSDWYAQHLTGGRFA